MSGWGTEDMAAALPEVTDAPKQTPQERGWAPTQKFDYSEYSKTNKEIAQDLAAQQNNAGEGEDDTAAPAGDDDIFDAVGGLQRGDWSSNAAVYEWNDEFGDVGPPFPALEKQLFGSEYHVKAGINFSKYVLLSNSVGFC